MEIIYGYKDPYEGDVINLHTPSYKEKIVAYAKVRLKHKNQDLTQENIDTEIMLIETELERYNVDLEDCEDFRENEEEIKEILIWEKYRW